MFNNCSIELASVRCSARQGGGATGEGSGPARAMLTGGEATLVVRKGGPYRLPRQELLSSKFLANPAAGIVSTERPKIRRDKPRPYSSRPMPSLLQVYRAYSCVARQQCGF
jgi:hypothetical protein